MAEMVANFASDTIRDYMGIEDKMQILNNEARDLKNRATDVRVVLEDEEICNGRKRKREVKDWFADVTTKKIKCSSLNQEVQQTRFYHFRSCLHLSRRIKETRSEIEKLMERSRFSDGLFLEVANTKGKPLVTIEWKGQNSMRENFLTVWTWLINDSDTQIGIYGMGRVGKTTLAMRIHNKLLSETKFRGHVYWIHVSHDSNTLKLQNDIAGVLNLNLLSDDNEKQRAAQLFAALKRRHFVLILDDVWDRIDTVKIGIPQSKLLITSRSVDVVTESVVKRI